MKKLISMLMAIVMVMTTLVLPTSACTIDGINEDGDPNVVPCEFAEKHGYCTQDILWYLGDCLYQWPNPYYKNPHLDTESESDNSQPFDGLLGVASGGHGNGIEAMQPTDEYFRDFVDSLHRDYADIIDYENMTVEYVDKNGNPTGYKTVITGPENNTTHYDPNGNKLTGDPYTIDWTVENPFAGRTFGTTQPTTNPVTAQAPVETAKPEDKPEVKHFDDVPDNAWYAEAVNALTAGGALKGYSDGLFHPENNVTVGELAVILYRLATGEEPVGKKGNPVDGAYNRDVFGKSDHWAAYAIEALWSREMGYLYKLSDRADEPATRGDAINAIYGMAASINGGWRNLPVVPEWNFSWDNWPNGVWKNSNYEKYTNEELQQKSRIPDIQLDPTLYYGQAMEIVQVIMLAYRHGIVRGVDAAGNCNNLGSLTRAELCQMLYNAGITQFTVKPNWKPQGSFEPCIF